MQELLRYLSRVVPTSNASFHFFVLFSFYFYFYLNIYLFIYLFIFWAGPFYSSRTHALPLEIISLSWDKHSQTYNQLQTTNV